MNVIKTWKDHYYSPKKVNSLNLNNSTEDRSIVEIYHIWIHRFHSISKLIKTFVAQPNDARLESLLEMKIYYCLSLAGCYKFQLLQNYLFSKPFCYWDECFWFANCESQSISSLLWILVMWLIIVYLVPRQAYMYSVPFTIQCK